MLLESLSRVNAYECERECDLNEKCKSYAYGDQWHQCKLQTVADPPIKGKFREFVWCAKSNCELKFNEKLNILFSIIIWR